MGLSKFLGGGEWTFLDSVAQRWTQQISIWLETREMLACTCSFNTRSSSQMKILRPKPSAEDGRGGGQSSLELGDTLEEPHQILQLSPEPVTAGEKQTSLLQICWSGFLSLAAKLVPKGHSKFSICLSGSRFRPCLRRVPGGGSVWTETTQAPLPSSFCLCSAHKFYCPEFALLNTCKVHQDLFTRMISSVLFKMAKCC